MTPSFAPKQAFALIWTTGTGANVDLRTSRVDSAVKLHSRYLAEKDAEAARSVERWRAATRISLVVLLAGSTLQLYLMHVYATIAALPTLGIGVLR